MVLMALRFRTVNRSRNQPRLKSSSADEPDVTATGSITSHDTVECESCKRPGIEAISVTPSVRLYWVKDQDTPVDSMPPDILHESHFHLRSKALQQRQNTPSGSTCYDMEVFYQFWSHFLIRNFNTRMYEEFQRLALDDEVHNGMDVGLLSLIKLYTQCLLSPQTMARYLVVRNYVALVEFEDDGYCPALHICNQTSKAGASILAADEDHSGC